MGKCIEKDGKRYRLRPSKLIGKLKRQVKPGKKNLKLVDRYLQKTVEEHL